MILRPPRPSDVADRLALGSDPEIVRMFGADPADVPPLTEADVVAWLDRVATHPHAWIVEHAGRLVGGVRLDALIPREGRASLAIGLCDPGKLGIGIGRAAVKKVLRHASSDLRLHRVGLRVAAHNRRAIRCYEACGFVVEGRERETALVGGRRHDDIMMGILAREFTSIMEAAP